MAQQLVCTQCGKEITVAETFPGGWYSRCNTCCSFNEGDKNYVYEYLGRTPASSIRQMINKGLAKYIEVKYEFQGEEQIPTEPSVEDIQSVFNSESRAEM